MEEHRRFVRLEAAIAIQYKLLGLQASGPASGVTRDVSAGGVRFPLMKRLESGTQLELELNLPGEPAPIRAKGQVVWCERFETGGPYEAGLRFTQIDPLERGRLLRFIHNGLKAHRPFIEWGGA